MYLKNIFLKIKERNSYLLFSILCFFVVGFLFGIVSLKIDGSKDKFCSRYYEYLNSHLSCKDTLFVKKVSYLALEDSLKKYFNSEKSSGRLIDVGVFFRDLEDGPTFDIDANKLFISASLIKLPTVMTVMRIADQYPDFLNKKVFYEKEISSENQDFAPENKLQVGKSYSIDELVSRTLQYSDNAANELLVYEIVKFNPKEDMILNTFKDLGLMLPGDVSQGDLSTKSFSFLLRLLYNASFLSKQSSEKILSLLDKANFKYGLQGGVPEDVRVASKFGERELDFVSKEGKPLGSIAELHDCGIVYYPKNPYLLCVMTKGRDFKDLSRIISKTSEMVYKEVDSRKIQ